MTCLKSKRRGVRRSKPTWGEWTNRQTTLCTSTGRAKRQSACLSLSCSAVACRCATKLWPVTWHDAACGCKLHPACSRLSLAFDVISCKQNGWLINLADTPKKMRAMGRAEIANGDLPNMKNIIINSSMILWLLYQIICYLMPTLPTHQKNM